VYGEGEIGEIGETGEMDEIEEMGVSTAKSGEWSDGERRVALGE